MTEETLPQEHVERTQWDRRRPLVVFIGGSIIIAIMLVLVSMALYVSSGAAQLDLSRPGYKSVQDQVNRSDTFQSFPATGPVTNDTIEDFLKLYIRQTKSVSASDAFNPEALSEQALAIDAPANDE